MSRVLTLAAIESRVGGALARAGASPEQAASVARSVARAEADGIRLVGLGYLPVYLAHLRAGRVNGKARPRLAQPRAATLLVDADAGFAHPAFDQALNLLVAATRDCGVASLAIRNSYSIGVLGHPVEDIARQGMVALAFTNSPPNIAPWGGQQPLFGTNPMAFAAPRAGAPLVIDQSASVVTKVALVAAAKSGHVPAGWALDDQGQPTNDPDAALRGSMMPFGGAKGAGLALMVDLLAAGLTGANFSKDVVPYGKEGPPPGVGQFFVAFDPDAFAAGFIDRIEDLAAAVLAQPGARLPGDRRLAARATAAREGVAIDDATWAACELGP